MHNSKADSAGTSRVDASRTEQPRFLTATAAAKGHRSKQGRAARACELVERTTREGTELCPTKSAPAQAHRIEAMGVVNFKTHNLEINGSHRQGRRKQGRAARASELVERTTREGIEVGDQSQGAPRPAAGRPLCRALLSNMCRG